MEVGSHRLEKWLATDSCRANIQKKLIKWKIKDDKIKIGFRLSKSGTEED